MGGAVYPGGEKCWTHHEGGAKNFGCVAKEGAKNFGRLAKDFGFQIFWNP